MKKIRVYDLKPLLEGIEHERSKLKIYGYDKYGLAIVEGNKGVLAFDKDGVGVKKDSMEDTYEVAVEKDLEGRISIIPLGSIEVSFKEIVEKCTYREQNMSDFIRVFGSRIEQNFSILVRAIDEIGENSQEYHKGYYRTEE